MTTYDPKTTALLLIDPYNDFLSEGGKLWPRAKPIAEEVGLLDNLHTIMHAAGEAGLARKNHAKAEATSSLRARKLLNRRCRACSRAGFEIK